MTGKEYREIRKRIGLTQEGLAERLGVCTRTITVRESLPEVTLESEKALRWVKFERTREAMDL
jgi:transcriptional regulator with XRE-family HTH domain